MTDDSKYTGLYLLNLLQSQTLKPTKKQQRSTIVQGLNELCKNNNGQLNTMFYLSTHYGYSPMVE